jgi:hypothetical protein
MPPGQIEFETISRTVGFGTQKAYLQVWVFEWLAAVGLRHVCKRRGDVGK